jgi:hypothetical protein
MIGNNSAVIIANNIVYSFKSIKIRLIVSISSNIPREEINIRFNNIVISKPASIYSGVVQYNFSKIK